MLSGNEKEVTLMSNTEQRFNIAIQTVSYVLKRIGGLGALFSLIEKITKPTLETGSYLIIFYEDDFIFPDLVCLKFAAVLIISVHSPIILSTLLL